MWFTASGSGRIGRIAADGTLTWPVAGGLDRPYDLVTGADGNLWVTESGGHGAILRVTTARRGHAVRAWACPIGADPRGIAAGADGNLYVAAYGANALARVGLDGTITTIPLSAGAGPRGVAASSDGSIWFTAYDGGRVGSPDRGPGTAAEGRRRACTAGAAAGQDRRRSRRRARCASRSRAPDAPTSCAARARCRSAPRSTYATARSRSSRRCRATRRSRAGSGAASSRSTSRSRVASMA